MGAGEITHHPLNSSIAVVIKMILTKLNEVLAIRLNWAIPPLQGSGR